MYNVPYDMIENNIDIVDNTNIRYNYYIVIIQD